MNRRNFIKSGALFVPSIFIPRLVLAQNIGTAEGLAAFSGPSSPPPAGCPADGSPSLSTTSGTESGNVGSGTGNYYIGQIWNDGGTPRTICKVAFRLSKIGDISTKTFVATIFAESGGSFNSSLPLATSSGITGNNSWSGTRVVFNFGTTFTTTASASYVITITMNGTDTSNHATYWATSDQIAGYTDGFNSAGACQLSCGPSGSDLDMGIYWQ